MKNSTPVHYWGLSRLENPDFRSLMGLRHIRFRPVIVERLDSVKAELLLRPEKPFRAFCNDGWSCFRGGHP